jgi:formate-dependent phosphoribosylglycinamide formyltransferase (GAR transformylase)
MEKLDIIAAPLEEKSLKLLLFGAGELGKEIAIEAQRLGMEIVAVDRYERAPAQQVAHKSYTVNMMDANAMRSIVDRERPDISIPEIEAIDLDVLFEFEEGGYLVTPAGTIRAPLTSQPSPRSTAQHHGSFRRKCAPGSRYKRDNPQGLSGSGVIRSS